MGSWTGEPSKQWRISLLDLVASFSTLQGLEGWPLLPVKGNRLRALNASSMVKHFSCDYTIIVNNSNSHKKHLFRYDTQLGNQFGPWLEVYIQQCGIFHLLGDLQQHSLGERKTHSLMSLQIKS